MGSATAFLDRFHSTIIILMQVFVQNPVTLELLDSSYGWTSNPDAAKDFQTVPAAADMILALDLKSARVLFRSDDPAEPDFALPARLAA